MITDYAKQCAGNHRHFESFAWFDEPDDSENWAIIYTSNRDSGSIDRANEIVINKALEPFVECGDVVFERHSHWACGHVDGFRIRVYNNGEVTEAFKVWADLKDRMDDYPILDESVWSEIETEEQNAAYENWARADFIKAIEKRFGVELDIAADPPGDLGHWQTEFLPTDRPWSRS